MTDPESRAPIAPPRRRRRAGLWVLLCFVLVVSGLGVGVWAAVGKPLSAPEWLRDRIADRLAAAVPDLAVTFGELGVVVQPGGNARIRLGEVDVATPAGAPVASLESVEVALSLGALLRGQLSLRDARVAGVFLSMQRDADGRLGLALGQAFDPTRERPDVPTLVAGLRSAPCGPAPDRGRGGHFALRRRPRAARLDSRWRTTAAGARRGHAAL